jgi:hypothetical protein
LSFAPRVISVFGFTVRLRSITISHPLYLFERICHPRTRFMKLPKTLLLLAAFIFAALFIAPPASIRAASMQDAATQSAPDQSASAKPSFTSDTVIYVSDFELDAQNVTTDQGTGVGQNRPGILERPRKREQQDPEAQARKLVNTMSESLVADLQKAGYKAQRVPAGTAPPSTGAWVHGVFTEVDEGSRIHRAVIGFGSGQATMNLYVTLSDLAHPDKPLYNVSQDAASKDKAGAVITMNPYVAAAKFVMEKNAPEKMVKKTAGEISAQVATQMKQYGGMPSPK